MPIKLSESRPLSIKERLFVDKYIQLGACKGAGKVSAEHAGYPASWSRFAAHRMLKNPRVMRAIESESKRLLRALGPKAIHVLSEILDDKEHRDRLKAARTIIERIDPTLVAHAYAHRVDVTVHDTVEMSLRMLRAMRELHVPREVQRERLGPNIFDQLEAALDSNELEGNGKAPASGPLMIEGEVVEAEPLDGNDDGPSWDDDDSVP
jgi:phage terminase small subunit